MSAVADGFLDVPLPRLSDSMEEGTILAWLVEDGAPVTRGQEIVEVETDKATMPYEAERDGVLHIAVAAGETVAVGTTIAHIAPEGVAVTEPRSIGVAQQHQSTVPPAPWSTAGLTDHQSIAPPTPTRVSASPLARRIAAKLGIDLTALDGSGPNGRVVKRDVLAAETAPTEPAPAGAPRPFTPPPARSPAPPPAIGSTRLPLTRLQQTIARRMTESKQSAPDFVLDAEIEMDAALAFRTRLKELIASGAPTVGDLVIKASALALKDHPRANGAYHGDNTIELFDAVNVGVAVATDEGILVPTVRDADARSLGQIARDVRALAHKAREGKLTPQEMGGATFTVSNLGMFGIDAFTAVLSPPQAAILAVGAVRERPVARDGQFVVANTMVARLTCDHRILNGADGAALLARIRELLQAPELLAL